MPRVGSLLLFLPLVALTGAPGAIAQVGCQPTLTQPCARPQSKPGTDQPGQRGGAAKANDTNEPTDHSARIKLHGDTDFKFGTGGIGIGRKF
jgi:hypothetical protein